LEKDTSYNSVCVHVKGAPLQLLMNRDEKNCFAQVPERVSTKNFIVLIIGNSRSIHLGAQGTVKVACGVVLRVKFVMC